MATELAKAYVQIVPSAKGIKEGIENELESGANSGGKSAGNKIVNLVKGVIAGGAIASALTQTIKAGAALQQNIGGIETLFGEEAAEKIKDNAKTAFHDVQMSANDYMETVTSFSAALINDMGGNTSAAADKADMALKDMADNANKMGSSMESIQNAYAGFAKGNYTMLDNLKLGYGGTKSEMEKLLKDAQQISGVKYDINHLSDIYDAIHVIQNEMGLTGSSAAEAETTISGSFNAMKASFQNLLGYITLGEDIAPALEGLLSSVETFLIGNALPAVENIIQGILTTVSNLISGSGPDLLGSLGTVLDNLLSFALALLPQLLDVGLQFITWMATGIVEGLPSIISGAGEVLVSLLDAILSGLGDMLDSGTQLIQSLSIGLVNNIPQIIISIGTIMARLLQTIIKHLPQLLQSGMELLGALGNGLVVAIPAILEIIAGLLSDMWNAVKNIDWLALGNDILTGIANGVTNAAGFLVEAAIGAAKSALESAKSFLGIHSPSTVFRDQVGAMMAEGMGEGFVENAPTMEIQKTVKGVVEDARDATISPYNMGITSPTNNDTQSIAMIISLLQKYLPLFADMKVVLDDDVIVGRMNRQLGLALR
ncbi:MAG: hypothetical protein IJH64_01970 [Oscillospiraceae bacterium]|nr:hypothetical protein [Oscillospiraceae bacterium]